MVDVAKLQIEVDSRSVKTANTDLAKMDTQGRSAGASMAFLKAAVVALGGVLSAQQVIRYADAWQNATNQLKTVQKETENLTDTQNMLMAVANETRAGFETTANLYTRLSRSTESLNLTQEELIDLTETINKSFAVSGASAQEASNAIIQLSQGLAAGALRGEEFNSVSEQSPILMQAIADSLNMTRGELRAFAAEGGITAEIVVKALQEASEDIDSTFSKMMATPMQQMTVARNNVLEFFGSSELLRRSLSAGGEVIITLSENMDELGNIMIAAGVGVGAMGAVHLVRLAASLNAATVAQTLFNRAAMLNPYMVVGTAIATATYGLITYTERQKEATKAIVDYVRATSMLDPLKAIVLQRYEENQRAIDAENVSVAAAIQLTKEQQEAITARISELNAQTAALQMSERELFIHNATVIKGVQVSGEYAEEIRALAAALFDEKARLEATEKAQKELNDQVQKAKDYTDKIVTASRQKEIQYAMTARQAAIYNAVMAAGTNLTTEQMIAIEQAVGSLFDLEQQIEKTKDATEFWTAVAEDGAKRRSKAEEDAARVAQDNWQRTHEYLSQTFVDIWNNGSNAFDNIAKSFSAMIQRMVAEWAASGLMTLLTGGGLSGFSIGGGGGGGSFGGSVVNAGINAGINKAIGGAITGGSVSGFLSGAAGTATGIAAGTVGPPTAAASAGAGASSALAGLAANPVTWAVIAAGLVANDFFKGKESPSGNAGLLIHNAPGAPNDQKFAVDPFDSGFSPIGFARREDQGAANQVIDVFRQYDAALTNIAKAAGITPDFSNNPFGGYDENASGNGLFLGVATEDGKVRGAAVEQQLDRFVGQWIDALGGNITAEERNMIKSAGNADAMIKKAAELAGLHGSHRNGLAYVPFDGYRAELHRGEEVLRASDPRNSNNSSSEMNSMFARMSVELMRIAEQTKRTSDILLRVTRDGNALLTEAV